MLHAWRRFTLPVISWRGRPYQLGILFSAQQNTEVPLRRKVLRFVLSVRYINHRMANA